MVNDLRDLTKVAKQGQNGQNGQILQCCINCVSWASSGAKRTAEFTCRRMQREKKCSLQQDSWLFYFSCCSLFPIRLLWLLKIHIHIYIYIVEKCFGQLAWYTTHIVQVTLEIFGTWTSLKRIDLSHLALPRALFQTLFVLVWQATLAHVGSNKKETSWIRSMKINKHIASCTNQIKSVHITKLSASYAMLLKVSQAFAPGVATLSSFGFFIFASRPVITSQHRYCHVLPIYCTYMPIYCLYESIWHDLTRMRSHSSAFSRMLLKERRLRVSGSSSGAFENRRLRALTLELDMSVALKRGPSNILS